MPRFGENELLVCGEPSAKSLDGTSAGIGSSIMGIALMFGMLVTPYAEDAFASLG